MDELPRDARQRVLDSAIEAFARKGYAGTSVRDIVTATGRSKPTLYYHFGSKAGLFRSILDFAYDESFRRMQESVGRQSDGPARLVAMAGAIFEFAESRPNLTRLAFAATFAAPEEIPPGTVDPGKRRRNFEFVHGLVQQAQKAGELDRKVDSLELTHGIFGAVSHQVRTHLLQPNGPLDARRAKRVVALFLKGARPAR